MSRKMGQENGLITKLDMDLLRLLVKMNKKIFSFIIKILNH